MKKKPVKKIKRKVRKGDQGTKTWLVREARRNILKKRLLFTKDMDALARDLGVCRNTLIRDVRAIKREAVAELTHISPIKTFLEYKEGKDQEEVLLLDMISKLQNSIRDARNVKPGQKPGDWNATAGNIIAAIRTLLFARKERLRAGQSLGVLPMVRPGIDIQITIEEKREIVMRFIQDQLTPIFFKYIKDPEVQRNVAREIDGARDAFVAGAANSSSSGNEHPKHQR